jgi:hypothetical protein
MNHVMMARRVLSLIESKGLDEIPWSVVVEMGRVTCSVYADRLNEVQARNVKRHFGPFQVENGYSGKNLWSEHRIDDSFRLRVVVNQAFTCMELSPEEISEEKWDDIRQKVREGLVKIQDCSPVEPQKGAEGD